MADNVEADPGSGGATFGTFDDGSAEWPGCVPVYVTGGSAGAWTVQKVDATHGLPVTPLGGTQAQVTLVPTVTNVTNLGTMSTLTTLTSITNVVHVDDNSSSLTVDGSVSITGTIPGLTALGTITNVVHVDDNSSSLTVDGTVTANIGTGTMAGLTAIGNIVGTITLPTGASTAAKQPALGTAGSASTDVITIQGIASMTKLLVTPDANSAVNVAQINGVTPLMGAGNTGTGSPRVTIATDQATLPVQEKPGTSGGLTGWSMLCTNAAISVSVKSSPGQIYGLSMFSTSAAPCFARIYDMASAPASTDTASIIKRLVCPGNTQGAGLIQSILTGLQCATGVGIRITAGIADNDNTALPANAVIANVDYK